METCIGKKVKKMYHSFAIQEYSYKNMFFFFCTREKLTIGAFHKLFMLYNTSINLETLIVQDSIHQTVSDDSHYSRH